MHLPLEHNQCCSGCRSRQAIFIFLSQCEVHQQCLNQTSQQLASLPEKLASVWAGMEVGTGTIIEVSFSDFHCLVSILMLGSRRTSSFTLKMCFSNISICMRKLSVILKVGMIFN